MKKLYIFSIISMLVGMVLFVSSIILKISWIGILGYFAFVVGIICIMFTTKLGFAIFIYIGIACILGLMLFFGPIQLVSEIQDLIYYNNNKDSIVEISAVITDISEKPSGDGGSDYVAYVSYEYNNKTYNRVHFGNVKNDSQLNSTVNIQLFPDKPNEIVKSDYVGHIIGIIWFSVLTVFFILLVISLLSLLIKKKRKIHK